MTLPIFIPGKTISISLAKSIDIRETTTIMRAVIQRVASAMVSVEGKPVGKIGKGLLILLGVAKTSKAETIPLLAQKISSLRIFEDTEGKINLSALDVKAEILIVSQFTLYANCKRGRRPDFSDAARPETAIKYYDLFIEEMKKTGLTVESGIFGAMMEIGLVNHGPLTIILDEKDFSRISAIAS